MSHDFHHHWWVQNEDYLWINDKSEIIIDGNQMTIMCNEDYKKTYTLIGTPSENQERLDALEEYTICVDEPSMVEDAAAAFGCTVLENELYNRESS